MISPILQNDFAMVTQGGMLQSEIVIITTNKRSADILLTRLRYSDTT